MRNYTCRTTSLPVLLRYQLFLLSPGHLPGCPLPEVHLLQAWKSQRDEHGTPHQLCNSSDWKNKALTCKPSVARVHLGAVQAPLRLMSRSYALNASGYHEFALTTISTRVIGLTQTS